MAEPILPCGSSGIASSSRNSWLAIGGSSSGETSYVPTYAQRVVGVGAVVAGLAMATMTIGWPIAATLAPRIYMRIGFRPTALLGGTITILGTACSSFLSETRLWRVSVAGFVLGVGLGFVSVSTVVAVHRPSVGGDAASSPAPTCSSAPSE